MDERHQKVENQVLYNLGSTIKLKCTVKNIIIVIFIKIIMMIINIRWRTSWGSSRSTLSGRRATGCSTMTRREEASGVLVLPLIFLSINFHFLALSLYLYLVPSCLRLCICLSLDILFQRTNRSSSQRSSKSAAHRRYLLIINISSSKYQYHLDHDIYVSFFLIIIMINVYILFTMCTSQGQRSAIQATTLV